LRYDKSGVWLPSCHQHLVGGREFERGSQWRGSGCIGDRLIAIGGVRGVAAPTEIFDLVEIARVK
jgi:hypothetical protein